MTTTTTSTGVSLVMKVLLAVLLAILLVVSTIWFVFSRINSQEKAVVDEQARQEDETTIKSLKGVATLVELYYEKGTEIDNKRTGQNRPLTKHLPIIISDLSLISQGADRHSGIDYEYLDPSTYKLCATFLTSNYPEKPPVTPSSLFQKPDVTLPNTPGAWFHDVGYHCFENQVATGAQLETAVAKYGVKAQKKQVTPSNQNSPQPQNNF